MTPTSKAISYLTSHLKAAELLDVEGFENDLTLMCFPLKNGHVLEKVTIEWGLYLENPAEIISKILEFSNHPLTLLEP